METNFQISILFYHHSKNVYLFMVQKEMNREELKQLMIDQLQQLQKKITVLKGLTGAIAPDDSIGRVSRMDAINNRSVNEAALRQAELKRTKLQEALENVHDPDFGLCKKCGRIIQTGRIILMPESNLCVKCASR